MTAKKRQRIGRKLLSVLLIMIMLLSTASISVFAEDLDTDGTHDAAAQDGNTPGPDAAGEELVNKDNGEGSKASSSVNNAPEGEEPEAVDQDGTPTEQDSEALSGDGQDDEALSEDGIMAQADELSENAQKFVDKVTALAVIGADNKDAKKKAVEEAETLYAALTDEEKALTEVEQAYQVLLGEKQALSTVFYVGTAAGEDAAYDEASPIGSAAHPYPSLAEAAEEADKSAEKSFTFILTSDLTATECARINGTDITIDGKGHTITRGGSFATISDNARSWYNPAMIEVCAGEHGEAASLYLKDITLNDGGKTAGTRYSQASANGTGGNGETVQDAIIAAYRIQDKITLGRGTTLNGYGGMSSVRLSAGTLTMEAGSTITGGKAFSTKGGGNGPAGAVWIQGGSFTMNAGASIDGVMGRAVYLDGEGSNAVINGTISNITANSNMWQGTDGVAMHVRNESKATLGSAGTITGIDGGSCVLSVISSSFEAQKGSQIYGTKNTRVANINGCKEEDKNPHIVLFDGTVKNCGYGDVLFWAWYGRYVIGLNAVICDTTASSKGIGMFYLQNGGEMDISGKIQDNNNTVAYMGNQGGSGTIVKVQDGAYIHNNQGYGIYANNSGKVIMEGGEISENSSYGLYIRSKSNWPNASLDMSGGKIINNKSYGIYYTTVSNSTTCIDIAGGEISGNGSYSPYQIYISGAYAKDDASRAKIKQGVVKAANGKQDVVYTSFAQLINLPSGNGSADLYLGNAQSAASNEIKALVKGYKRGDNDTNEYVTKGSALWFKASADTLEFNATRPSKYTVNYNLPLYVAYIPLKTDGTPVGNARLTVKRVNNEDSVNVNLTGLEENQAYALMWMQPTEKFGTFTIAGTPEIREELGTAAYDVDYAATYTVSKEMQGYLKQGDTFSIEIKLDERLAYQQGTLQIAENDIFELAEAEPDIDKKEDGETLAISLKLKADPGQNSAAEVSFKATALLDQDELWAATVKTNGTVSGSVKLPGDVLGAAKFVVETPGACKTNLVPLPTYKITYTGGGFDKVKEGTELLLSLGDGGTIEGDLPNQVTSDITLPDPVREGYLFDSWSYTHGKTAVTFVANWRLPEQLPMPTDPVDPAPTPDPPAPTPTPAPAAAPAAAPAVAPVAPIAAPLAQVADDAVPLAGQDADDTREVADGQTPLAKGAENEWALLNLILMVGTVLASVLMLICFFLGRKEAAYEDSSKLEEDWNNEAGGFSDRKILFRFLSLIPAAASIIFFVLTEDMANPMAIVDRWTPWMVVFALVNVVFAILSKKKRYGSDDTQKPGYGMA